MNYTISLHTEGDRMVIGHNRRDDVVLKEKHIDTTLVSETWVDIPLKQFYERTFSESVEKWNLKVDHVKQRISDYYATVKNDHKKHLVYESIIQIGSRDSQPNEETCRAILKDYLSDFQKRNPTMEVVGAYYHADEPNGTPHMHLDYVPVARNCTRGMTVQNSHNKAIMQLGIEKGHYKNLAHAFQERERVALESICKTHDVSIERGVCIDRRKHQEKEIFVLERKLERLIDDIKDMELIQTTNTLDIKSIEDIVAQQERLRLLEKQLYEQKVEYEKRQSALTKYAQQLKEKELELEQQKYQTIEQHAKQLQEHDKAMKYDKLLEQHPELIKRTIDRDFVR